MNTHTIPRNRDTNRFGDGRQRSRWIVVSSSREFILALLFILGVMLGGFINGKRVEAIQKNACSVALWNQSQFDFAKGMTQ